MGLNEDYIKAKAQLKIDQSELQFNKNEKETIEKVLDTYYSIQNNGTVDSGYLTAEEYQEVIKYVEEIANLGVDQATLRVTPEETWLSQQKVDTSIKPLQLKETKRRRGENSAGSLTVAKSKLDKVVNRIKIFMKSGQASKDFIKRADAALKELESIENQTISYGRGTSQIFKNNNLPMRLNHLYSQINTTALQQAIGDIGEHFSGAVLAALNAKSAYGVEKITKDFLRGLPKEMLQQVGTDKTFHYQAQYSTENNGVHESVHATQDKVDMIVELNGKKINLSVKNYAQISSITIFSGNLLSLLGSSQHYSNLLRSYAFSNDDEKTYQLLRKISFVKALVGGQRGRLQNSETVITTPTADYLIVNHQGRKFYAWSMAEIVRKLGKDVSIAKFDREFPRSKEIKIKGNSYEESVFSSHISLLTKTLRKKELKLQDKKD